MGSPFKVIIDEFIAFSFDNARRFGLRVVLGHRLHVAQFIENRGFDLPVRTVADGLLEELFGFREGNLLFTGEIGRAEILRINIGYGFPVE